MPVYIVDKPLGLTSHDLVVELRRRLGTGRVGHAGTLDPLATGVLVVLTRAATKLSPFLSGSVKHYLARVAFGASTPTLDAEGPVTEVADTRHLSEDRVRAALPPFLELTEQVPPQYSAVKRDGITSHRAARRGQEVVLPPRAAGYRRIDLLAFASDPDALPVAFAPDSDGRWRPDPLGWRFTGPEPLGLYPTALLDLEVAAGTYVRAFARDLGAALGVPAHLSNLVRTRAGRFGLDAAQALGSFDPEVGLGLAEALPYPLEPIGPEEVRRVRQGQRLPLRREGRHGLIDPDGDLVAVAEGAGGRMRLLKVFPA